LAGDLLAELERERSHSSHLLESMPAACAVTDVNGTIDAANRLLADLTGVPLRYLVGKPLPSLVMGKDRRPLRVLLLRLGAHGEAGGTQLIVRLQDRHGPGSDARITVLARAAEETGRLVWLFEPVGEDAANLGFPAIDEVVRARVADAVAWFRTHEEDVDTLERAFRQLPLAAYIEWAGDRRPPVVTRALELLLDGTPEPLAAARAFDDEPVAPDDLPVRRSLRRGETVEGDRLFLDRPDGRSLRVEVAAQPVRGGDGHVVAAVGVVVDLDADATQFAVERDFLAAAAHQLQNPPTAISTAIEVLQSGAKELPDERDRFLEHIERSASRLTRVVRSLLVLLRHRIEAETLRRRVVLVAPLLEAIAHRLDPDGSRVVVTCDDAVSVLAEQVLLETALENLVVNALRHAHGRVRLTCEGGSADRATISVTDSGPGLPEDVARRIAEASAPRAHQFLTGPGGLGLAIVMQITQLLRGELAVASDTSGTTISIALQAGRRIKR
jgi:PAS domain S-box-containing protein